MKYQKGFAPLIIIILVVLGIGVAGGGYVVYKDKQQEAKHKESIENLPNSQSTNQVDNTNTQPRVPEPQKTEPAKTTTPNTSVPTNIATKLNCDNNWSCLISAANQCQSASGAVSYNNVPNPIIPGLLNSGRTQYEIKKSSNSCTVISSVVSVSLSLTMEGRSKALADGSSNAEIDAQLKTMNDSFKGVIGLPTTCVASGSVIASYLGDQKNGNTGGGEFHFSADSSSSVSQSTVTTSSGQKITCSTQQPTPFFKTIN